MNVVLAAAGPFALGAGCLEFGIRLRKGLGTARLPGGLRVGYDQVPSGTRTRASDANLVLGMAWLSLAVAGLRPGPIVLVPMAILLLCTYPYYSRHRDLRRAAQEAARSR